MVNVYCVGDIFGEAFLRIASMQTIINGAKKCGIFPFDPLVFPEVDFIPDRCDGKEDHAASEVSTTKERDRTANVESPQ